MVNALPATSPACRVPSQEPFSGASDPDLTAVTWPEAGSNALRVDYAYNPLNNVVKVRCQPSGDFGRMLQKRRERGGRQPLLVFVLLSTYVGEVFCALFLRGYWGVHGPRVLASMCLAPNGDYEGEFRTMKRI